MRPSSRSPPNGGCRHSRGSPSVTTSVWPSSRSVGPAAASPIEPSTLGRPGATSWTSTTNPSARSQRSTWAATAASVAPGSPGRTTLGMRTSSRVSAISSSASMRERTSAARTVGARRCPGLLLGEGQDHRVQADDTVLLELEVEVVPLDLLGTLLERDDRRGVGHLPKGVGALVEPVPARHHLTVADGRALGAVHTDVGGHLGHHPHEKGDAVHLDRNAGHEPPRPTTDEAHDTMRPHAVPSGAVSGIVSCSVSSGAASGRGTCSTPLSRRISSPSPAPRSRNSRALGRTRDSSEPTASL